MPGKKTTAGGNSRSGSTPPTPPITPPGQSGGLVHVDPATLQSQDGYATFKTGEGAQADAGGYETPVPGGTGADGYETPVPGGVAPKGTGTRSPSPKGRSQAELLAAKQDASPPGDIEAQIAKSQGQDASPVYDTASSGPRVIMDVHQYSTVAGGTKNRADRMALMLKGRNESQRQRDHATGAPEGVAPVVPHKLGSQSPAFDGSAREDQAAAGAQPGAGQAVAKAQNTGVQPDGGSHSTPPTGQRSGRDADQSRC